MAKDDVQREIMTRKLQITARIDKEEKQAKKREEVLMNRLLAQNKASASAIVSGGYDLVAGTTWLFAPPDSDDQLDYLVIDEAGQLSLADALAAGTAATNLILLGDPLQLPQVSQATHPLGTDASILEHLLGEDATVAEDRGIFLNETWRMHPDVCAFISDAVYDGRLEAEAGNSNQRLLARRPGPQNNQ